jgi:hypothetical protein
MAEEPEDEDDDEYDEEEEIFDDDALRGFRFFWNNVNGEEHDEEDNSDEEDSEEWEDINDEVIPIIPTANFIAEKLRDHNVSYEDLVKILLLRDHEEYQEREDEETVERLDGQVFGKMRVIISNYVPQQVVPVQPSQTIQTVDLEAQPKTTQLRFTPNLIIDS